MNETKKPTGYPSVDKPWLKYYDENAETKANSIPLGKTVWDVIEERLYKYIDVPAIEYFGRTISRKEFISEVYLWARALKAIGVEENEVIPYYGPFMPDICAIVFALNMIGACPYFLKLAISPDALAEETKDSRFAIVFDQMWDKLSKLIKDDGAIVLFGNEPFSSNLRLSNSKLYRYDWKWIKTQVTGFQNAKYQPLRCYEDIMVFSKCGAVASAKPPMRYYPQGTISVNLKVTTTPINYLGDKKSDEKVNYTQEEANYPRNVIQFARETDLYHPTQKPIVLMEYIVSTYSKRGDLVLDFTSGSGSTLLACEVLNRRWIGIELTDKYCEVIKKRIQKGIQLKLQFEYDNENTL